MPSKTQSKTTKSTCQHVFTLGKKKGKKCGKGCRDDYCCDHKKSKQEYKSQWFQNKMKKEKEIKHEDAVSKIYNCTDVDKLPSPDKILLKIHKCKHDYIHYCKKLIGHKINTGLKQEKEIEKMKIFICGKCKCVDEYKPTKKEIETERNELVEVFLPGGKTKTVKNNKSEEKIIEDIKQCKVCIFCSKYTKDDCKYCSKQCILYNPTNVKIAISEVKIKKLEKKINKICEKYSLNHRIYNAINEMNEKIEIIEV